MKPKIIRQIEQLHGDNFYLHKVSLDCPLPLNEVQAVKKNKSKYLLDEQDRLIGLNLAATELNDDRWRQIVNLLEEYAVHLQALNLCENQLENFVSPPDIAGLTALDLEDNPLEYPSRETMKQDWAAVLRFLQAAATQGTRKAFEVKMLIVGEGETGKTTLWNLLQNPEHPVPSEQDSTVGIQIKEGWEFAHIDRPEIKFLVNLWDFGGQEIQYMTHQFFLTRRSFYVLLADGRKEAANFPYWLDIISLLGRDSDQEEKLPVLVVLNEKGNKNPSMPYDQTTVEEQYPGLEIIKRDVDFAEKGKRLEAVNETIKEILCHRIAHLPIEIPVLWDEVRKKLKTLQESRKHIDHEDFLQICRDKGINDREQQDDLSQLFHDLGFILHFREPSLEDFVVLNPDWAVNAVYAILENDDVKDINQGRFNQELLRIIWTEKGFSAEERGKLLNLMLKDGLEVCFRATENNEEIFIAPQLLPEKAPADARWKKTPETLRYVYHYPFMPKGIIGRLIVRLHENIESCTDTACECGSREWSEKMVWKNGVYLCKDRCRARVRFINKDREGREIIMIEVQSKEADDRKHVLREIRHELDLIHRSSFPSLKLFEKIPCNCEECRNSVTPNEHDNAKLDRMKSKGIGKVQCDVSGEMISIRQLQDGVFRTMDRFAEPTEKKENSGQASVVIQNHSPPSSHQTPVDPAKKPWYQRWWAILIGTVTLLAGLAGFTGYPLSEILKLYNK